MKVIGDIKEFAKKDEETICEKCLYRYNCDYFTEQNYDFSHVQPVRKCEDFIEELDDDKCVRYYEENCKKNEGGTRK